MQPFVDLSVPGKMRPRELEFLGRMAASVPDDGIIVEVGPLFGRSTVTLARSAPKARVYSIDTFEREDWIARYESTDPGIRRFGIEAFRHYTRACPNVVAIQGRSPEACADWNQPVDLYFEDAVHGNPTLHANISFWKQFVKPGGIVCGHDYALRWPDVKREVDALAAEWGTEPEVINAVWGVRRPLIGQTTAPRMSETIMPSAGPAITVLAQNRNCPLRLSAPLTWAGRHLEPWALVAVTLRWQTPVPGVDVEYAVEHPEFGRSDPVASGQRARLIHDGKQRPFWNFAAWLTGPDSSRHSIRYRTSYRQIGGGGHALSGIGEWAADGALATARKPGAPATSLQIEVIEARP